MLPTLASDEIETRLTEGFARLLKDPSFLLEDGALGFGFDHKHRVSPTSTSATALGDIEKSLKGLDESIRRVCESPSHKITIRAVYHGDDDDFDECSDSEDSYDRIANYPVVLNSFADFGSRRPIEGRTDMALYLSSLRGAKVLYNPGEKEDVPRRLWRKAAPIVWMIKDLSKTNAFSVDYIGIDCQRLISDRNFWSDSIPRDSLSTMQL